MTRSASDTNEPNAARAPEVMTGVSSSAAPTLEDVLSTDTSLDDLLAAIVGPQDGDRSSTDHSLQDVLDQVEAIRVELDLPDPGVDAFVESAEGRPTLPAAATFLTTRVHEGVASGVERIDLRLEGLRDVKRVGTREFVAAFGAVALVALLAWQYWPRQSYVSVPASAAQSTPLAGRSGSGDVAGVPVAETLPPTMVDSPTMVAPALARLDTGTSSVPVRDRQATPARTSVATESARRSDPRVSPAVAPTAPSVTPSVPAAAPLATRVPPPSGTTLALTSQRIASESPAAAEEPARVVLQQRSNEAPADGSAVANVNVATPASGQAPDVSTSQSVPPSGRSEQQVAAPAAASTTVRALRREPVLIKRVLPEYPRLATETRVTGDVDLDVLIEVDGRVREATVVAGAPTLRAAAQAAVLQWQYEPALLGGVPVGVKRRVRVSFK